MGSNPTRVIFFPPSSSNLRLCCIGLQLPQTLLLFYHSTFSSSNFLTATVQFVNAHCSICTCPPTPTHHSLSVCQCQSSVKCVFLSYFYIQGNSIFGIYYCAAVVLKIWWLAQYSQISDRYSWLAIDMPFVVEGPWTEP